MTQRLPLNALDPDGATDGQGPVYDATLGRVAWADPPSGSGVVESIVPGTGIAVDSTDPANPVVSATGPGGTTPTHHALLQAFSGQGIPAATSTKVNFTTAAQDYGDLADLPNSRFTIPLAGLYIVTAFAYFTSDPGDAQVQYGLNGAAAGPFLMRWFPAGGFRGQSGSLTVPFAQNDLVDMRIRTGVNATISYVYMAVTLVKPGLT